MINRVFAFLGVVALSLGAVTQAQDYDDIYGSESPSPKNAVVKTKKNSFTVVKKSTMAMPQPPVSTDETVTTTKVTIASNMTDNSTWDVDSYNRRGAEFEEVITADSTVEDNSTFANTERIERFYNPDVVVNSNDEELLELYFENNPSVNIIVGSPTYVPTNTSWYSWYDPFSFYDPYYYGSWGYRPWRWHSYWSWGWGYNPWRYNYWGWSRPWGWHNHWGYSHWGWSRPHYYTHWGHTAGWDRPGHYSYRSGLGTMTRRPSSRVSTYSTTRMGSRSNVGTRRASSTSNTRVGMSNGRTRPVTEGMSTGRRAASRVGNMSGGVTTSRSTQDITTRSTTGSSSRSYDSSGSRRSSYGTSSSSSRNASSRSSYSSSSSRSSSSSSSSRSYGSSSSRSSSSSSSRSGGGGRRH